MTLENIAERTDIVHSNSSVNSPGNVFYHVVLERDGLKSYNISANRSGAVLNVAREVRSEGGHSNYRLWVY